MKYFDYHHSLVGNYSNLDLINFRTHGQMQTKTMYGYETAFALRSTDTPSKGPRDLIETLTEILQIFSMIITEAYEFTPTPEFVQFLEKYLVWLESIDDDTRLYDFRNKSHLTEIKSFLTYPHPQFEGCIQWMDELLDIAMLFQRTHDQLGARVINTLPRDKCNCLGKQFAAVNTRLSHILRDMPPADYATMKENNRQLYYELNKSVLKPQRIQNIADKFGIDFFDYLEAIYG